MTQKPYRDTTHLMVQGHEGWLEVNNMHYHAGAPVEVLFKWGHNMKVDGLCQKERLVAYAFDPEGTKRMLSINDRDEESYAISFAPEREGYYQVVVEQNGIVTLTVDGKHLLLPKKDCENPLESSAFTQFAKAVIPVGHHLGSGVQPAGTALELVSPEWRTWRAGDTMKLQVFYRGQAVSGAMVTLACGGPVEAGEPLAGETGADGNVEFVLLQPGNYLALVRHVDRTEYKEGYYDQRRLTATLPVLVIK